MSCSITTARLFTASMAVMVSATLSQGQTLQRSCDFDFVFKLSEAEGMQRGQVDWTVTLGRRDKVGQVVVDGSGVYDARAKTFANGAMEYLFATDVSKESITVGPTGEALWDIQFTNGDVMGYTGVCDNERQAR